MTRPDAFPDVCTVEFVGGAYDGVVTTVRTATVLREMPIERAIYGLLDLYEDRTTLYLIYGHITDEAIPAAAEVD